MIVWCYWEALEEAKDGRCNMELVAGSGELDKTRFREALLEYRLGGSLANLCILTDCLVDRFPLGRRRRGILPSSSVSDNTLACYLCLHLSSLLLFISFYYYVALNMD